jgi:hypothetical protein
MINNLTTQNLTQILLRFNNLKGVPPNKLNFLLIKASGRRPKICKVSELF